MRAATVYEIATNLAFPLVCGWALSSNKLRPTVPARLGYGAYTGLDWQILPEAKRKKIWFHAASVGEVVGLEPLIKRLCQNEQSCPPVITTMTETGKARAKKFFPEAFTEVFPFDYRAILSPLIKKAEPDLVVVNETELWPTFFNLLGKRSIPLVLVNARISDYAFPNYLRFRPLFKECLEQVDAVFAQTETDLERFVELGLEEERGKVTGSTKYDKEVTFLEEDEREKLFSELGLDSRRPTLVAGSVREQEMELLLTALRPLLGQEGGLQIVLVPRHPESFEQASKLISKHGLAFSKRSEGPSSRSVQVSLIDTMGELQSCYQLADICFIGATFVDIGGHNPLEAAAYAKPIISGPYVSNIREEMKKLEAAGGGKSFETETELAEFVTSVISNSSQLEKMGDAARGVFDSYQGVSDHIANELRKYLDLD